MLTKEDYMKLPKERLAELLVENDSRVVTIPTDRYEPFMPCYAPNGICTNPHRDCINCPRPNGTNEVITTTNTSINTNKNKGTSI